MPLENIVEKMKVDNFFNFSWHVYFRIVYRKNKIL